MEDEIKTRYRWVTLYLETNDAGLVCRKCGISRPTLREWARRYQRDGMAGLQSKKGSLEAGYEFMNKASK